MRDEYFNDNRRVKQGREYADYLAVAIRTQEGDEHPRDYDVAIARYTCPGRYDTYWFALGENKKIQFHTETNLSLTKAAAMAAKDLARPQVVEMIDRIRGMAGKHDLFRLIEALSPRHPSVRRYNSVMKKRLAKIMQGGGCGP